MASFFPTFKFELKYYLLTGVFPAFLTKHGTVMSVSMKGEKKSLELKRISKVAFELSQNLYRAVIPIHCNDSLF